MNLSDGCSPNKEWNEGGCGMEEEQVVEETEDEASREDEELENSWEVFNDKEREAIEEEYERTIWSYRFVGFWKSTV